MALKWLLFISIPSLVKSETIDCGGDCDCSSSISGETCTLDCTGSSDQCKDSTLTCRSGDPCIIICNGNNACSGNMDIDGSAATDVDITCSDIDACKGNTEIFCGSGVCTIECDGDTSCENANIDTSSATYFQCTGDCPNGWTSFGTLPSPSAAPSEDPTNSPSLIPSREPTISPTEQPTDSPTSSPTTEPSPNPTSGPSMEPTSEPTMIEPTDYPTPIPTPNPAADGDLDPLAIVIVNPTESTAEGGSGSKSDSSETTPEQVEFQVDSDSGIVFYGLSVGDIIMIAAGLIVGSCCCLCIVSVAYYNSKKQLSDRDERRLSRGLSTMSQVAPDGEEMDTEALPAPPPRAASKIPFVVSHDTCPSGSEDEVDGDKNALPKLPSVPKQPSYVIQTHHDYGDVVDAEGGDEFARVISPGKYAGVDDIRNPSLLKIYSGYYTSDGGSSMFKSVSPELANDHHNTRGMLQRFLSNFGNGNSGKSDRSAAEKSHKTNDTAGGGDKLIESNLRKDSLDEIDNDLPIIVESPLALDDEVIDPEIVEEMESPRESHAEVTRNFIGGGIDSQQQLIELNEIPSHNEDVNDVGGQLIEHETPEYGTSSEDDNLVTIGHV